MNVTEPPVNPWLSKLEARRNKSMPASPLANRNARTIWVLAHDRQYEADYGLAT